jgi:hypothetical protein
MQNKADFETLQTESNLLVSMGRNEQRGAVS